MLRKVHRLTVFENKVLTRIVRPKRHEMKGGRKLQNEELHSVYSSSHIDSMIASRRMRWVVYLLSHMGKRKKCIQNFYLKISRVETKEDIGIGGVIVLKSSRIVTKMLPVFIWLSTRFGGEVL
jgi:hypothetical protein